MCIRDSLQQALAEHAKALGAIQQQVAELNAQNLVLETQSRNKAELLAKAEEGIGIRDQALSVAQQQQSELGAQMASLSVTAV